MPPTTKMTPEQVAKDLAKRGIEPGPRQKRAGASRRLGWFTPISQRRNRDLTRGL